MMSNLVPRTGAICSTLDQTLRQNAQKMGDSLALADAPDRPLWADGAPRRMSWNQVDAAVSAVAGRFFEMGLPSEAVIAVHGLNVTDTLIGIMGCIRAGLVTAIMPIDFTPAEIVQTAERLNAKAIVSARKIGQEQTLRALRHLVDESVADIRFVGAFGADLPGGIVSFEDCIGFPKSGAVTRLSRREKPEDNLAIITIDRGPAGMFAVARNHREWSAAASIIVEGLALSRQSHLLSPMAPSSLAGLASGLVAWLMSGCQLILHQAFDSTVFAVQLAMHGITHAILPDLALQAALADGMFSDGKLVAVAGLTRAPHGPVILPETSFPTPYFAALGEVGMMPLAAGHDGRFTLPFVIHATGDDQAPVVETMVDQKGYLALRGQQISMVGFDVNEQDAIYQVSSDGWVSTHYPVAPLENGWKIEGERYSEGEERSESDIEPVIKSALDQPVVEQTAIGIEERPSLAGAA